VQTTGKNHRDGAHHAQDTINLHFKTIKKKVEIIFILYFQHVKLILKIDQMVSKVALFLLFLREKKRVYQ